MSDDEFWLKLWKYIIAAFVIVFAVGAGSCTNHKYQLRKMSETHNPIVAACALNYSWNGGDSSLCGAALKSAE